MRFIAVIGSSAYKQRMIAYKKFLEETQGVKAEITALDDYDGDEFQLCQYNRTLIERADEVHVFWDGRSIGTVFDLGMCFALLKPIKLAYLEPKSFANLFRQYDEASRGECIA